MNKKVFILSIVFMILIGSMGFAYNGEESASVIGYFDYTVQSPRNLYHNYNFSMDVTNNTSDVDIQFKVYDIDDNTLITSIDRTIPSTSTNITESIFSGLTFSNGVNTYRYEVSIVENDIKIFEGFVAKTPSTNWYDGDLNSQSELFSGVAVGDVVYNDIVLNELLHDESKVNQTVFTNDDFMTVHFKYSSGDDDGGFIQFWHENSTDKILLDFRDIQSYQGVDSTVTESKRSFLVVPVNGLESDLYSYDTQQFITYGDNIFTSGFLKGVYTYAYYNASAIVEVYGQSDILIGNGETEYDFYLNNSSIKTGSFIYTNTLLNTSEIYDVYGDIVLSDFYLGNNYSSQYTPYQKLVEFKYRLVDQATNETQGEQRLYIEPNETLAKTGFGFTNYSRRIINFYEIRFTKDVGTALTDFLESFGLGGDAGGIFFTAIVVLVSAVILGSYAVGTAVIGIVTLGLITAFAFIGLLPVWFVLLLGIFGALTLFNTLGGE